MNNNCFNRVINKPTVNKVFGIFLQRLKIIFLLNFLMMCLVQVNAQVTTDPEMPYDNQSVTIYFDASAGSQGLINYSGDVYAHTGVITDQSSSSSDWKYVKADWNENIEDCKMTSLGDNQYSLTISTSIRDFYGVPDGEKIEQVALVFRSSDGSKEGKTADGGDIFISVYTNDVTVTINSPKESAIYKTGASVPVSVSATNATSVSVFLNSDAIASSTGEDISTSIVAGEIGEYILTAEATDGSSTVSVSNTFYVRGDVVEESMPEGMRRGVNVVDDQTVTFVLYAPDKAFVYVIGSFNDWETSEAFLMKQDGDYFWLTVSSLDKDTEYAFQFFIDGEIRVADPYTNKTLDPNDQYISSSVFPGLMDYPDDETTNVASVFKINSEAYNWVVSDFASPEKEKMVIYELLIRDFTDAGDIKTVTDSISYFVDLGVNVIELMPFNEFEGNDSWGYNPSFYFATDKAYGTANDYKEFIDVCHQNGIAVLMDMVLNHSFSQSPFVRMYQDEDGNPSANNPWYNQEHNMKEPEAQWGYDFNHESEDTQELVDSICNFWLTEFKLDGFRFDFTKGFTNTEYPVGDWASAYDADRIAILERMVDAIWTVKSDAIVAFEHLSDNSEETELANYGILPWGNHNYNFNEATMGYADNSDFSWASYKNRGWEGPNVINYMESHDEERIMYKNISYGDSNGDYDVTDLETALERTGAAAAFLLTIPGPKMIWQFGELGYDYSINYCTDGSISDDFRTSKKPIAWDYYNDEDRKALFDVFSRMIQMKTSEPVFSSDDFEMDVSGAGKVIKLNYTGSDLRLVGNFDVEDVYVQPDFSSTGLWYDYFNGDSIEVTNTNMQVLLAPGDYILYCQKKMEGFTPGNVTSEIDSVAGESAFVYPNPVSEVLYVNGGNTSFTKISLNSISGDLLLEKNGHDMKSTTIDVSNLSSGIYMVHLIGNNNVNRVFKILKE